MLQAESSRRRLKNRHAARSEVERNTTSRAGNLAPGIRSAVGDPQTNTVAKGEVTKAFVLKGLTATAGAKAAIEAAGGKFEE